MWILPFYRECGIPNGNTVFLTQVSLAYGRVIFQMGMLFS